MTASWPVIASATSSVSTRLRRVAHRRHLGHQLLVDVRAGRRCRASPRRSPRAAPVCSARRAIATGCSPGTIGRVATSDLPAELRQLLLRRRASRVERGHQHLLALARLQPERDLGGGGGLARALQPDHQHRHRRRRVRDRSARRAASPPSISTRWSWTILTTIWPGVTARSTSCADRRLAHRGDEVLDHRQRDVRLEQRHAHLAQRRARHPPRSARRAAQPVEDVAELGGQRFEHDPVPRKSRSPKHKRARARHSRTGVARKGRRLTSVLSGRRLGPGPGPSQGYGSHCG